MKKQCPYYILSILLTSLFTTEVKAQICHDTFVNLDETGHYTLNPYLVIDPDVNPAYEPVIIPADFTCDHLGENRVDVYFLFEGDTVFSCFSTVTIVDHTPPTAACITDYHVVLDENGEYTFTFEELDNGSSNICDNFFYRIEPWVLTCHNTNPAPVQLIIKDHSENFDTCIVLVTWEEFPITPVSIDCPAFDTIRVFDGPYYEDYEYTVTSDSILLGGPYHCSSYYFVQLYQGGDALPYPIVTFEDIGETFQTRISDLQTGDQCFTELYIEGIPGCDVTFDICDTQCKGEPIGDCGSGHTDTDDIEWPCDLLLTGVCPINWAAPVPEELEWYTPDIAINAWPEIPSIYCEAGIFIGYYDPENVETSPTSRRITREWTILNWVQQEVWTYNQTIEIHFDVTEICDTQPWNTPTGDCDSGHSLEDDVEWPADVTVESAYYLPVNLANNPDVAPENVQPRINAKCNLTELTFLDEVTPINDTTVSVERTWTIVDSFTGEIWTYTQHIQAKKDADGSVVCIINGEGTPIAEVTLVPGIITDSSGCYAFMEPDGVVVTPSKEGVLEEDINLLDIILLKENLLSHVTLSEQQKLAADVNNTGGVSALDYVVMRKIILGNNTSPAPKTWRFYEPVWHASSMDISDPNLMYQFFGIKTGDVDYGYFYPTPDYEDVYLKAEDEILNKGESYSIPFTLSRSGNYTGFAVRIQNPNQNLEFIHISAPGIPDFDEKASFYIEPGSVSMLWVALGVDLPTGYPITTDDTLFILELKATEDVILNEELSIDVSFDNLLAVPGDDDPFELRFEWEDIIISSTINLGDDQTLTLYPNPFRDQLFVKGIRSGDEGQIFFHDALGRLVLTTSLQPVLNVESMDEGMYFVTIQMNNGSTSTTTLLKL